MWPGPCHRHGFAVLINGAGRIATMQPALVCSLSVVWGCQRAAEYAIKGRLIHVTQPWFAFWGRMRFFRVIFQYQAFDRWDHGFAGGGCAAALLCP
jgi:hypothetical protein